MDIKPIRRLAIVNRGEAAMRCIRTVKSLRALEGSDLQVIALYTDVDRDAPFVRHADVALRLPADHAGRGLPRPRLLLHTLQAGRRRRGLAGLGLRRRVARVRRSAASSAGIRFLGPSGDTMRKLGDKIASKHARRARSTCR